MELKTTRFGKLDIAEEEVITFEDGLYGFEDQKQFVLLTDDEPFFWLQAVNEPDLAFVVTEPWVFCEEYEFELSDRVEKKLALESKEDVLVVNMVVIPDNPEKMTMNLKSPVIINKDKRIAKQIILEDEGYPIKYPLVSEEEVSA